MSRTKRQIKKLKNKNTCNIIKNPINQNSNVIYSDVIKELRNNTNIYKIMKHDIINNILSIGFIYIDKNNELNAIQLKTVIFNNDTTETVIKKITKQINNMYSNSCNICYDLFINDKLAGNTILLCSHCINNICATCLLKIIINNSNQYICPFCKMSVDGLELKLNSLQFLNL